MSIKQRKSINYFISEMLYGIKLHPIAELLTKFKAIKQWHLRTIPYTLNKKAF